MIKRSRLNSIKVGQRYGRLVVLSRSTDNSKRLARYNCLCDCGKVKAISGFYLILREIKSCGCDGELGSSEYNCWSAMKYRCLNPRSKNWIRYGGRGITVCPEWIESFEVFLRDMGPKPSPNYSINRIDNDLGYYPENCEWALPKTQALNKSNVRTIKWKGVTSSITMWSRRTGIPYSVIRERFDKKLPVADILENFSFRVRL